ncbi:unnamed protein product [Gongylonema pulchrum]|uniref:Helitron_like_N domain-containing protein n=1 Tax=Gongylonema pulchrum TaxID=637853 RepID=A0A183DUE8_9BILA|nr:unnamed protein product [Gongylonema pulchrum]
MQKKVVTTEIGRSLFATVHGLRYIEWTLHIYKLKTEFSLELVRETNCNILGEYRVLFSARSGTGKKTESWPAQWHKLNHRIEYVPDCNEKLAELYRSDEFSRGQVQVEIQMAFAASDFENTIPPIDPDPLLVLLPYGETDERMLALHFVQNNYLQAFLKLSYRTCPKLSKTLIMGSWS